MPIAKRRVRRFINSGAGEATVAAHSTGTNEISLEPVDPGFGLARVFCLGPGFPKAYLR